MNYRPRDAVGNISSSRAGKAAESGGYGVPC